VILWQGYGKGANMFDSVSGIVLLGLVFDSGLTEYMSNDFRFFLLKASLIYTVFYALYSMQSILCVAIYDYCAFYSMNHMECILFYTRHYSFSLSELSALSRLGL
jgi:hypothetical protein